MEPPPPSLENMKWKEIRKSSVKLKVEEYYVPSTFPLGLGFSWFRNSNFFYFNFCLLLFVKIFWMNLAPAPTFQKDDTWRMFFFFCWKRCSIISSIFWSNILFTKVLNDIGYDFNLGPISNFFNLILHVLTKMKIAQSKKNK